jgi:protein phosphatase/serine/threonine-protein phosphatase Stp1
MAVKSWALTNPGAVRKHNEDNMLSRPDLGLFVVADGAGGHDSGELASGMIVAELNLLSPPQPQLRTQLHRILDRVHAELRAKARVRGNNAIIASTFVSLVLEDGQFTCIWAGDSRAYLLRHGELSMLSRDHSLVQALVDSGRLTPEEAEHHPHANVITRAVGADCESLELDEISGGALPGDRFLLCSDGLSKSLSDAEIGRLLAIHDNIPPPAHLIEAALGQRARDNVTAIVVEIAD